VTADLAPWMLAALFATSVGQLMVLARAFGIYDRLHARVDRLLAQLRRETESARSYRDHVASAEELFTPDARRRPEPVPEPAPRRTRGTPPVPARDRPWSNLPPKGDETVELRAIGGRHLHPVREGGEVSQWT
jgi:hypothetical protein